MANHISQEKKQPFHFPGQKILPIMAHKDSLHTVLLVNLNVDLVFTDVNNVILNIQKSVQEYQSNRIKKQIVTSGLR